MVWLLIKDGFVINSILWEGPDIEPMDFGEGVTYIEAPDGVGIGWSYNGKKFAAPPLPEKSLGDLISEAESTKAALLSTAGNVTADWRTELELGIISDDDRAILTEWMIYIRSVKAVDTSTAPDITWPQTPGN